MGHNILGCVTSLSYYYNIIVIRLQKCTLFFFCSYIKRFLKIIIQWKMVKQLWLFLVLHAYFDFRKLNLAVKCVFSVVDVKENGAGQEEGRSCGEHGG